MLSRSRGAHPLNSAPCACVAIALACALAGVLFSPRAPAQSAADRATARSLAAEGEAALEAGRYQTAEDRFRRADALVHAPTLVVAHGRALIGLGRLVEAYECFQLVLREGVDPGAPQAWHLAEEQAAELSAQVEPRIAWLTVAIADVPDARVEIDATPVPPAALGVPRATDPGTRVVSVSAAGFETRRLRVTLGEGARRALRLVLTPTRGHAAPTRGAASPQELGRDEPQPSQALAFVMLGAGGFGILVGSITGALTLDKKSTLDSVCVNRICPQSAASDLDSYYALGTVSAIALGLGGACAVGGFVLWLNPPSRGSEARAATGTLELRAGPGGIAARGTFP